MTVSISPYHTQRPATWTNFKAMLFAKYFLVQYEDDGVVYTIWGYDGPEVHCCTIWKGTVPDGVVAGGYSQVQNDADKTDFETYYKSAANASLDFSARNVYDPRVITRMGNKTTAAVDEVLCSNRGYTEQSSQAQRSVVSTSANDANPSGSGAKAVRITYLTSAYVQKTEDINLNGTSAVDTVGTDIRFIQKFQVIKGAAAAGAIKIMTTTGGGGSEFCGIGVGTFDAFLCHHYVPAGKRCFVLDWSATVDDDVKFKLMGRATYSGNVVDEHWDLVNLTAVAASAEFKHQLRNCVAEAQAYIRVTIVPGQVGSTITRSYLTLLEVPIA